MGRPGRGIGKRLVVDRPLDADPPERATALSHVPGGHLLAHRVRIRGLAEYMPFEAKALAPSGSDPEAIHGAFADAATGGVAVLEAPSGHVLTEGLASALSGAGRAPLWLRLEPEDRDPATFLVSLATAAQRTGGGMGLATLKLR